MIPEGWTDDMRVPLPPGKREVELVVKVLDALVKREPIDSLEPVMRAEYGLSDNQIALVFDRVQAGVVRAITGHSSNRPDRTKDPIAWFAFAIVWSELPRRHFLSFQKKPAGRWLQWFEEVRQQVNSTSQQAAQP